MQLVLLAGWLGCGAAAATAAAAPPAAPAAAAAAAAAAAGAAASGLQVGFMSEPLGLDRLEAVHFSWQLPPAGAATRPGLQQLAARVVVAEAQPSGAPIKTVFDSGRVNSSRLELVADLRDDLRSDTLYIWTVHTWCSHGAHADPLPPSLSDPASFSTGLLRKSDWKAEWIRGGTQCRTEFEIPVGLPVQRASIFVAACQYHTLELDGKGIGQGALNGPWTSFYTNRSYSTLHLAPSMLTPGKHALGLRIGQGFCTSKGQDMYDKDAERSGILQLQVDGLPIVWTNSEWSCGDGPIRSDSTYFGEEYDARLETPGWSQPNFSPPSGHASWQPASTNFSVVAQLNSEGMPPVRIVKELASQSVTKISVAPENATCATGAETDELKVECPGNKISAIDFFSWGTPLGSCSTQLRKGSCATLVNLTELVRSTCVGQESCSVKCYGQGLPGNPGHCTIAPGGPLCPGFCTPTTVLNPDPCDGTAKNGALDVTCAVPPPPPSAKVFKYVFDFGQEFAGVVRLTLPPNTPAGTRITLKHAEALAHPPLAPVKDGSVYMGNLFWANPVDIYTAKGGATPEVYQPSMTYHGFRFVELSISDGVLPSEPTIATVVGLNLRTAAAESATMRFGASPNDPTNLVQKLSNNSWWTEAAALMSIPAGAAGRGERNGWTGDAAFAAESESFDFDTGAFFARYVAQVADYQGANGEIGGGVPNAGTAPSVLHMSTAMPFDPSWSAVFPNVAYALWKNHGAEGALEYAWPGLTKYMQMLDTNYTVGAGTYGMWGDWNPAYPQPRNPQGQGPPFIRTVSHITAAAMVLQNHIQIGEMARALGKLAEANMYESMVPALKQAYHEAFFDPAGHVYGDGTATAFGAALWLEVTPPEMLPTVVENFVKLLHSYDYRMVGVGFIGVRYIFEALAKVNRTDVALKMLQTKAYPSFGYCITNEMEPATSLWESYDVPTMHQWLDESSRDHHYSASINTFLRKKLAGLDQPAGSYNWATVKCRPEAAFWPELLPSASAELQSRRGKLGCAWSAMGQNTPPPATDLEPSAQLCAYSPIWTGAVSGPAPMVLSCPAHQTIAKIEFARWQRTSIAAATSAAGWHCYGPQPPAPSACESDVAAKLAPLCVGKPGCDLSNATTVAYLGEPCSGPATQGATQIIVRVACSAAAAGKSVVANERTHVASQETGPSEALLANKQALSATMVIVNATVPSGSTGEVHVPLLNTDAGTITESGTVVWRDGKALQAAVPGVEFVGTDGRFASFTTGSGQWTFSYVAA